MYESRIADKVFEAIDARSIEPLVNWLTSMGCQVVSRSEGAVNLQGLVGMRVGFTLSDPSTLAVCCGFALAGMYWPHVYPKLQSTINKRWKDRSKKQKEESECQVTS